MDDEHIEVDPAETSECPECGAMACRITDDSRNGTVEYDCSACGYEGWDSYLDLYGCMSVPWGYLF
jgi:predicted RNA-binding Zn-ribbon protein involved in translation (DUF1610 family)